MDKLINDYSFGAWLWMWQLFMLFLLILGTVLFLWAVVCLFKSPKQSPKIKLLVLISLFTFPIVSSLIYLSDYYSKDIKDRML